MIYMNPSDVTLSGAAALRAEISESEKFAG
ncbi:hypothetical protein PUN4_570013 [Paraburkholderia unamae]|nr:hypothetical protein PUN4_570013 [Paraburkholderia unamae]